MQELPWHLSISTNGLHRWKGHTLHNWKSRAKDVLHERLCVCEFYGLFSANLWPNLQHWLEQKSTVVTVFERKIPCRRRLTTVTVKRSKSFANDKTTIELVHCRRSHNTGKHLQQLKWNLLTARTKDQQHHRLYSAPPLTELARIILLTSVYDNFLTSALIATNYDHCCCAFESIACRVLDRPCLPVI